MHIMQILASAQKSIERAVTFSDKCVREEEKEIKKEETSEQTSKNKACEQ